MAVAQQGAINKKLVNAVVTVIILCGIFAILWMTSKSIEIKTTSQLPDILLPTLSTDQTMIPTILFQSELSSLDTTLKTTTAQTTTAANVESSTTSQTSMLPKTTLPLEHTQFEKIILSDLKSEEMSFQLKNNASDECFNFCGKDCLLVTFINGSCYIKTENGSPIFNLSINGENLHLNKEYDYSHNMVTLIAPSYKIPHNTLTIKKDISEFECRAACVLWNYHFSIFDAEQGKCLLGHFDVYTKQAEAPINSPLYDITLNLGADFTKLYFGYSKLVINDTVFLSDSFFAAKATHSSVNSLNICLAWSFLQSSDYAFYNETSRKCSQSLKLSEANIPVEMYTQTGATFKHFHQGPELVLGNEAHLWADFVFDDITMPDECAIKCMSSDLCAFFAFVDSLCYHGSFSSSLLQITMSPVIMHFKMSHLTPHFIPGSEGIKLNQNCIVHSSLFKKCPNIYDDQLGNGLCDDSSNTFGCNWDYNDCCKPTITKGDCNECKCKKTSLSDCQLFCLLHSSSLCQGILYENDTCFFLQNLPFTLMSKPPNPGPKLSSSLFYRCDSPSNAINHHIDPILTHKKCPYRFLGLLGNGVCDDLSNTFECNWDNDECCTSIIQKGECEECKCKSSNRKLLDIENDLKCPLNKRAISLINNNVCNEMLNFDECGLFDGGDCCKPNSPSDTEETMLISTNYQCHLVEGLHLPKNPSILVNKFYNGTHQGNPNFQGISGTAGTRLHLYDARKSSGFSFFMYNLYKMDSFMRSRTGAQTLQKDGVERSPFYSLVPLEKHLKEFENELGERLT